MKILLIGESGFMGSAILKEAPGRGHEVTAVVRNPERITTADKKLTIKKGDVSYAETVPKICRGADVVIRAYKPGWTNPAIYEDAWKVYPAILEGVKKSGVKRFLVTGSAGSLDAA